MKVSPLAFVFLICLYLPLNAELRTVTLQECIIIAMENHPDIKTVMEEKNKSVAQYNLSKAPNRILVNGEFRTVEYLKEEGTAGNLNIPGRDTNLGLFAGATATYNLYDTNRTRRQDSARIGIDLAKMQEVRVKSGLVLNVKLAYYGYALAKEIVALQEDLREKYRIKLEKTQLLFKSGQRPILDVTKAEVDLASARLEHERAKNRENLTKSEFLASMGIMDERIEVTPVKVTDLPRVKYTLAELIHLAEDNYPEIRISRLNKEAQRINIAVEKAGRSPVVDIWASLGLENNNLYDSENNELMVFKPDNWDPTMHAGITARTPLYSGGAIPSKIDAAKAEYNKSFFAEQKVLLTAKALIRNYTQVLAELRNQIDLSRLMRENAQKHLSLAQRSYDAGLGSQLDLKDAETAVINADVYFVRARYDYLMILAKLSNTVGLEEDYICER
jgi:outer membrane protein